MASVQTSRSARVYGTRTWRPVVPLEAWSRITSSIGTANKPTG